MNNEDIDDLTLDEIMTRWPQVLRVFIDWHLHCVGCPIAGFHKLTDSAVEHGYPLDDLRAAVLLAIKDGSIAMVPPRPLPRSRAADAGL